jgi:phosphoglycolate phosphatase-like HAD superfamily hydrolase
VNAVLKLSTFGLDGLLDFESGAYGSDPHDARSDLVAVARVRARVKYGAEPTGTVLVGDTPLDVRAAHDAGARGVAVATGPYGVDELRESGADAVLEDLRDTERVAAAVAG